MFKFIKRIFFGKHELLPKEPQKAETQLQSALEQKKKRQKLAVIPYNPELINVLEADHQVLLSTYSQLMEFAKNKDYLMVTTTLKRFSSLLAAHLKKEGLELYMYLEFVVGKGEGKIYKKNHRDFRLEMKGIAVAVMSAVNTYTNTPVDDSSINQFIEDFTGIGGVLVDRIQREEKSLYPTYVDYK